MNQQAARDHAVADLGRRSARGALVTLSAQVLRFLVQFSSMISLARLLTPGDVGLGAMIGPLLTLLFAVAEIGIAQSLVQQKELSEEQISSAFWTVAGLTLFLSLLLAAASGLIADTLYQRPILRPMVIAISPVLAISGLSIVQRALLSREAKFRALAVIDVGSAFFGAVAGVIFAVLGFGVWSLIVIGPVMVTSATVMSWVFCGWKPKLQFRWSLVRPLMSSGALIAGANLGALLSSNVDNVLIGVVLGNSPLGFYDQGYRLVTQGAAQLINPISRVMVPLMVDAARKNVSYVSTATTAILFQCVVLWPGLAVLATVPADVVRVVLGARWLGATDVIFWFSVAAMGTPLATSAGWLLLAENRLRSYSFVSIAGSVVTITAVLTGLAGGLSEVARNVALSSLLLTMPAFLIFALFRNREMAWRLAVALAPYLLALAVLAPMLRKIAQITGSSDIWSLFVATGASYALFLVVILFTSSGKAIIQFCQSAIQR